MLLLQPCQEKILQSRLLKDEWKEFYESSPNFNSLLSQVERSKETLKTKMADTPTPLSSHEWKYYTSTFPVWVLMTSSFVPALSLFASLDVGKFPWMGFGVYFMLHVYVTWSLLCCKGTIYLPLHKLRRPLINYTNCKCSCRACAVRFSFVLQIVFVILTNGFLSVWCASSASFLATTTTTTTTTTTNTALQCIPAYIWPETLPVLKNLQVTINNKTNTEWTQCRPTSIATTAERTENAFDRFVQWFITYRVCVTDYIPFVYWVVTVSSLLLILYHFVLVYQPRAEVSLDQQTQLWRRIFDERKTLWDKIGEEQKTMKEWDRGKASKTIQRNEVWYTAVNKCVYSKWKKKGTSL